MGTFISDLLWVAPATVSPRPDRRCHPGLALGFGAHPRSQLSPGTMGLLNHGSSLLGCSGVAAPSRGAGVGAILVCIPAAFLERGGVPGFCMEALWRVIPFGFHGNRLMGTSPILFHPSLAVSPPWGRTAWTGLPGGELGGASRLQPPHHPPCKTALVL